MADDRVNVMRGYKATLHNPNTSDEAKQNAQSVLDDLGGDQPSEEIHNAQAGNKDPMRVAAGYKAAQHNPNVTEEGKKRAKEGLGHLPEE
ncbi:Con-6 family protein [Aspergillus ruber CBS 135680]|uniref:Putative conidiation protein Con-6 n=1 Tax=Aspergillus ruber (strain CBS 135680) TaxID=1388766 RepID=A0A017S3U0_ASPRC|nr:putative conidiation protein Con-6 [Aspergillus ruber CBS 135680]EYE90860.1 putative conidiation protein Con-6 [Aspergillus ruber CBS 135680]